MEKTKAVKTLQIKFNQMEKEYQGIIKRNNEIIIDRNSNISKLSRDLKQLLDASENAVLTSKPSTDINELDEVIKYIKEANQG